MAIVNRAQALAIRKERVRKARLMADYTQEGLAAAVTEATGTKVTRQAIIEVEKGRIDLDTYLVEAIAELCDVTMDFLTGRTGTMELNRPTRPYIKSPRRDYALANAS